MDKIIDMFLEETIHTSFTETDIKDILIDQVVNNAVDRSESKKDFQIKIELDPLSIMYGARYKCDFCGIQFLSKDMFESHIQTAHIKLPPPESPPPKDDSKQRLLQKFRRENSFNEKGMMPMVKKARIEEANDDDGIVMLSSGDESSSSGTSGCAQ